MSTKSATVNLDERIVMLAAKKSQEWEDLKDQFHVTKESLRPMNLVKGAFHDITTSPEIKNNIIGNVVGLASGYLSKKIIFGGTHNPIKKVAGALLQYAVTNFVGKKMDKSTHPEDGESDSNSHSNFVTQ